MREGVFFNKGGGALNVTDLVSNQSIDLRDEITPRLSVIFFLPQRRQLFFTSSWMHESNHSESWIGFGTVCRLGDSQMSVANYVQIKGFNLVRKQRPRWSQISFIINFTNLLGRLNFFANLSFFLSYLKMCFLIGRKLRISCASIHVNKIILIIIIIKIRKRISARVIWKGSLALGARYPIDKLDPTHYFGSWSACPQVRGRNIRTYMYYLWSFTHTETNIHRRTQFFNESHLPMNEFYNFFTV